MHPWYSIDFLKPALVALWIGVETGIAAFLVWLFWTIGHTPRTVQIAVTVFVVVSFAAHMLWCLSDAFPDTWEFCLAGLVILAVGLGWVLGLVYRPFAFLFGRRVYEQELRPNWTEVSAAPVPANPGAVLPRHALQEATPTEREALAVTGRRAQAAPPRVRREAFMVIIGDRTLDVDEIRVWRRQDRLVEAARRLTPRITQEEVPVLLRITRDMLPDDQWLALGRALWPLTEDRPAPVRPAPRPALVEGDRNLEL